MKARFLLTCSVVALLSGSVQAQFQHGAIYLSSNRTNTIECLDRTTGTYTVFADATDGLLNPSGLTFTSWGTLLCVNYGTHQILEFDDQGNVSVFRDASHGLIGPWSYSSLQFDANGDLWIGLFDTGEILRLPADGSTGVIEYGPADGLVIPSSLAFAPDGTLYVANLNSTAVLKSDGAGGLTAFSPNQNPLVVVCASNGDLYVGDFWGSVVRYLAGDANRGLTHYLNGSAGAPCIALTPDESELVWGANDNLSGNFTSDSRTGDLVSTWSGAYWGVTSFAVYSEGCLSAMSSYGSGLAGAGGIAPSLQAVGSATPGGNLTLQIRDFVGGTMGVLVTGTNPDLAPAAGGTLYINWFQPHWPLPVLLPGVVGQPGAGDLDLSGALPLDSSLLCKHLYMQVVALDPAAPERLTMTNGVDLYIGN
jgi:hypothetical protein